MKTTIIALALACVSLCGVAADTSKSTDQQNIQGNWVAQSATANGFKIDAKDCQYMFSGDRLTIRYTDDMEKKEVKYLFKLDTTNSPKLLVVTPEQALTNATICSSAYELRGDSLKIALSCPGTRPTEISEKNSQMLIVFKRKSP